MVGCGFVCLLCLGFVFKLGFFWCRVACGGCLVILVLVFCDFGCWTCYW